MPKERISLERLREVILYDPDTGSFTWRVAKARRIKPGMQAGGLDQEGYWRIWIDGRFYRAASLAIFYMTGIWPNADGPDHINGVRDDNRFVNLRNATKQENGFNRKPYATNTSGFKGVNWHFKLGKWRARIQVNGKRIALGCFDTRQQAAAAYEAAARQHFGEFARGHHAIEKEAKRA